MVDKNKYKQLLLKYVKSSSPTEKEAAMLSIGFSPDLDNKFRFKELEKGIKDQNILIKRASIAATGFSAIHHDSKTGKKQNSILKKFLNEPLETIRATVAISLGINATLCNDTKLQKNIYKGFIKNIEKSDSIIQQGYAVGLGLLSKDIVQEDCLSVVFKVFNAIEMKNPIIYLIGLTLIAINTDKAEEGLDFVLNSVIPRLSNKESRRIAVICCAFLLPLISHPETRVNYLELLVKGDYEFVSKFGTDSALVLTYFSLLNDRKNISKFINRLSKYVDLDPDYAQIYNILKANTKETEILKSLIRCNTLDIKAAGINASFFLETEAFNVDIKSFIAEGLKQRGSGSFDRFLVLLRTFSFYLIEKKYDRAKDFEPFLSSKDHRVKKFAAIFLTCLTALNSGENEDQLEDIYSKLASDINEKTRWGMLLGLAMYNNFGENILSDELIIGLLLLCLGYNEAGASLLLSQAMVQNIREIKAVD